MSYEVAPAADREVQTILHDLAEVAGSLVAERVKRDLILTFETIGAHPAIGAPRPEWAPTHYRFFCKDGYWVVWRESTDDPARQVIVTVIDAAEISPQCCMG